MTERTVDVTEAVRWFVADYGASRGNQELADEVEAAGGKASTTLVSGWRLAVKEGQAVRARKPLARALSALYEARRPPPALAETDAAIMVLDELQAKIDELRKRLTATEEPTPMTEGAGFTRKG